MPNISRKRKAESIVIKSLQIEMFLPIAIFVIMKYSLIELTLSTKLDCLPLLNKLSHHYQDLNYPCSGTSLLCSLNILCYDYEFCKISNMSRSYLLVPRFSIKSVTRHVCTSTVPHILPSVSFEIIVQLSNGQLIPKQIPDLGYISSDVSCTFILDTKANKKNQNSCNELIFLNYNRKQ